MEYFYVERYHIYENIFYSERLLVQAVVRFAISLKRRIRYFIRTAEFRKNSLKKKATEKIMNVEKKNQYWTCAADKRVEDGRQRANKKIFIVPLGSGRARAKSRDTHVRAWLVVRLRLAVAPRAARRGW